MSLSKMAEPYHVPEPTQQIILPDEKMSIIDFLDLFQLCRVQEWNFSYKCSTIFSARA
jgi:hypothetical protein